MAYFTLDTSGFVLGLQDDRGVMIYHYFHQLEDFTQGYIEALFASAWPDLLSQFIAKGMSEPAGHDDCVRPEFSDLAPETLARIIADCGHFGARDAHVRRAHAGLPGNPRKAGAEFYYMQQRGHWAAFRPFTPYLGDDGKVYLREAA